MISFVEATYKRPSGPKVRLVGRGTSAKIVREKPGGTCPRSTMVLVGMVAVGVVPGVAEGLGVRVTAKIGRGLIVGVGAGVSVAREKVAQATRLNPIKMEKEIRRPPRGGRLFIGVIIR